jgi:hypothetical protein
MKRVAFLALATMLLLSRGTRSRATLDGGNTISGRVHHVSPSNPTAT